MTREDTMIGKPNPEELPTHAVICEGKADLFIRREDAVRRASTYAKNGSRAFVAKLEDEYLTQVLIVGVKHTPAIEEPKS